MIHEAIQNTKLNCLSASAQQQFEVECLRVLSFDKAIKAAPKRDAYSQEAHLHYLQTVRVFQFSFFTMWTKIFNKKIKIT